MTSYERLKELHSKVMEASGPDQELDEAVIAELGFHAWAGRMRYRDADGMRHWDFGGSNITGSIDGVLALVERVLPGSLISLTQMPVRWQASVLEIDPEHSDAVAADWTEDASTAPLVILACALTALIVQAQP